MQPAPAPDSEPEPASAPTPAPADTDAGAAIPGVVDGMVAAEVRCARCGYVLRGLAIERDCPECGLPIKRSIGLRRLVDADRDWLGRISLGMLLFGAGPPTAFCCWVGSIVLGVIAVAQLNGGTMPPEVSRLFEIGSLVLKLTAYAGLAMTAAGALLTTIAEPGEAEQEERTAPRVAARAGLVGAFLLILFGEVWPLVGPRLPSLLISIGVVVFVLLVASGLHGLLMRYRNFAVRLPSPTLLERCTSQARWYRTAGIAVAVIIALNIVMDQLAAVFPGTADVAFRVFEVFSSCTGFIIVLLTLIRLVGLFDLALRFRTGIRSAIRFEADASTPHVQDTPTP